MARRKTEAAARAEGPEYKAVNVDLIDASPYQTRKVFEEAEILSLSENIRACGLLNPITVRPKGKRFELIAGERRLRAWIAAVTPGSAIPCTVVDVSDAQAAEMVVSENMHRVNLSPVEEAEGVRALIDTGRTFEEVAAVLGRTRQWVSRRAQLVNLSPYLRGRMADPDDKVAALRLDVVEEIAKYPQECQDAMVNNYMWHLDTRKGVEDIAERILCNLDKAKFDTSYCGLNCPARTGAQPDLFGEVDDGALGLCLDPDCYLTREKQWRASVIDQAKHAFPGKPVFSLAREFLQADSDLINPWHQDEYEIVETDPGYKFRKSDLTGAVVQADGTITKVLLKKIGTAETDEAEDAEKQAEAAEIRRARRMREYMQQRLEGWEPMQYRTFKGDRATLFLLACVIVNGICGDDRVEDWDSCLDDVLKSDDFAEKCREGLADRLSPLNADEVRCMAAELFGLKGQALEDDIDRMMPPDADGKGAQ